MEFSRIDGFVLQNGGVSEVSFVEKFTENGTRDDVMSIFNQVVETVVNAQATRFERGFYCNILITIGVII